jgi:MFS family permease
MLRPLMRRRQLVGLILASAVITFDRTVTTWRSQSSGATCRHPSRGSSGSRTLRSSYLPQCCCQPVRWPIASGGFWCCALGSSLSPRHHVLAAAPSVAAVIAAKFAQGAAGAFVLPAALAVLRETYTDADERARMFGVRAAWTGAASAAGALMAGVLVDVWSWRSVFLPSAVGGLTAVLVLGRAPLSSTRHAPLQSLPRRPSH